MVRALGKLSRFLNLLRGLFLPAGLLALVAVGVHAGADLVDDQLLLAFDSVDGWLDGVFARFALTQSLVNLVGAGERTLAARALALGWELGVDGWLGLALLSYREEADPLLRRRRLSEAWGRLRRRPALLAVARPLETAVFVVAGAFTLERLVEGSVYLGLLGVVPKAVAWLAGRGLGWAALLVTLASPGWRSVAWAFEHADLASRGARGPGERLSRGVWGAALALPLALLVVAHARSLLGLVR